VTAKIFQASCTSATVAACERPGTDSRPESAWNSGQNGWPSCNGGGRGNASAFLRKSGGRQPACLSSPWFGEPKSRAAKIEHCPAAGVQNQERRASARRGSVTHSQWRRVLRTDQVCTADSALRTTAGSRQPLLVHDIRSPHKAPFAMHKRMFARAAGVSPPWFRFALATVIVFCGVITFRTAHSLPAPRLAHASRSWCTTFVRCTKRHLRCTNARSQERRASARRGSDSRLQR
jgi:hypothetical protein